MPNPGKIGLGVSFSLGGASKVLSTPIGIGSILNRGTLCDQQRFAMGPEYPRRSWSTNACSYSPTCQTAINLVYRRATPMGCFTLIQSIQEGMSRAREVIDTELLWVPAHVGVPGNEATNTAARGAAESVQSNSPKPIPLATSRALLRVAFERRRQQLWLRTMAARIWHRSPIQAASRHSQSTRVLCWPKTRTSGLGTIAIGPVRSQPLEISLGARRRRGLRLWSPPNPYNTSCFVGPLYASERESMAKAVRAVWKHDITEEVLLGGGGVRMPDEAWELVASAVAAFVRCTGRKM